MYIHSVFLPSEASDVGNIVQLWQVVVTKKDKKKTKDAQLVLRLQKDTRDRFVDACQELDTTAAREVRRFIKSFLKKYDKGELDDRH